MSAWSTRTAPQEVGLGALAEARLGELFDSLSQGGISLRNHSYDVSSLCFFLRVQVSTYIVITELVNGTVNGTVGAAAYLLHDGVLVDGMV